MSDRELETKAADAELNSQQTAFDDKELKEVHNKPGSVMVKHCPHLQYFPSLVKVLVLVATLMYRDICTPILCISKSVHAIYTVNINR